MKGVYELVEWASDLPVADFGNLIQNQQFFSESTYNEYEVNKYLSKQTKEIDYLLSGRGA